MSTRALLCGLALLAACESAQARAPSTGLEGPRASPPVPAGVAAEQLFSAGREPVLTGWEASPAQLDSGYCQQCHRAQHEAWSGGMHARAFSDPIFTRAFAKEPRQWCRNCHAPLQAAQAGAVSLDQGINCATCHVRDGQVLGVRARAGSDGVHAVRASAGFGGSALCAGCHQFNFPSALGEQVEYSDLPMQATIDEWRAAGAPACVECHQDGHAVRGPHDAAWLSRQVLGARWTAPAEGVLSLQLQLRPRGHAFPTGDNFHSFVLEVSADPSFATLLGRRRFGRELGKGFVSSFVVSDRAVLRDTSLPASSPGPSLSFDRPDVPRVYGRLRFFQQDSLVEQVSSADVSSALPVWSGSIEPAHL